MSAETYVELNNQAGQIPTKLLQLYDKKVQKGKGEQKFDETVRKFAISLHMKSASAYRYIRSCFADALPCERTLRKLCQQVDCSPGFSQGALRYLSDKSKEYEDKGLRLLCSLTFDEMSIRTHVEFNGNIILKN